MGKLVIYNAEQPDLTVIEHEGKSTLHAFHNHTKNFSTTNWQSELGRRKFCEYNSEISKINHVLVSSDKTTNDYITQTQSKNLHSCNAYWSALSQAETDPEKKAFAAAQAEYDNQLIESKKTCTIL